MPLNQRAILLLGTVAAVALTAAAGDARADQINVSATITASCEVGDADLEFGNYEPDKETSTTLTVTCTAPADVGLTLNNGLHPNGSRRMKHASEEQFLAYQLCDGSCAGGQGTVWTAQEVLVEVGASGTGVEIGGRIPGSQPGLPSGSYTDVVLVTLDVKS
jgi:spore coat protein U-like protein